MRRTTTVVVAAALALLGGVAACGGDDARFGVHEDAVGVEGDGGFPDDIPVPEDAEIVVALGGVYTFYVSGSSPEEVRAFYDDSDLPGLAFDDEDLTPEEEEVADDMFSGYSTGAFDGGEIMVFPAETESGDEVTQINVTLEE